MWSTHLDLQEAARITVINHNNNVQSSFNNVKKLDHQGKETNNHVKKGLQYS